MALMDLELGSVDTTIIKLITNTKERETHQRRVNYRTRPSFKTLVVVSSQGKDKRQLVSDIAILIWELYYKEA